VALLPAALSAVIGEPSNVPLKAMIYSLLIPPTVMLVVLSKRLFRTVCKAACTVAGVALYARAVVVAPSNDKVKVPPAASLTVTVPTPTFGKLSKAVITWAGVALYGSDVVV
jgi:hypothetical protein